MSREIRISIDDDEVFERMKRRKEELDLSWEETLRRGLGEGPAGGPNAHAPHMPPQPPHRRPPTPPRPPSFSPPNRPPHDARGPHDPEDPHDSHTRESHGHHADGGSTSRRGGHDDRPWDDEFDPFDPDFQRRLQEHIQSSVQEGLAGVGSAMAHVERMTSGLDDEIDRLSDAEDAVLAFDVLEGESDDVDDASRQVPLRVNLTTSAEGLGVEVVAIRHGKGTEGMNRFGPSDRATVARHLAGSGTASLRLQNGAESYDVVPRLVWGRAPDGTPTVTDVTVTAVSFDD
ncbi:hypothetical protein [Haloarchaeobius sp. DFWS5]|uniref:hypothetical protein n=1 Tax=Haloarchaeobius sp. DFWS5 TaxID=3446114 RepID=UPI003EBC2E20